MDIEQPSPSPKPPRLSRASAAELLRQQVESGLSVADFASEHGILAQTLYRWRKVLGAATTNAPTRQVINVTSSIAEYSTTKPTLVLRNGCRLEHPELLSRDQLRMICETC